MKGSREYVRSAVEGSLERLNIKQIDLYYQVDTHARWGLIYVLISLSVLCVAPLKIWR